MSRRTFSKEFKYKAVQRVLDGERCVDVAADLGVRYTQIDKWRRLYFEEQKEAQQIEQQRAEIERLRNVEIRYQELQGRYLALQEELCTANSRLFFLIDHFNRNEASNT